MFVAVVMVSLALNAAPKLVAPAWTTSRVEADVAKFFAEHFERQLRNRGAQVISATDIEVMLGVERQKQLLGCSEGSCVAELGNALGADAMVVVSVTRLDGTLRASIKVLDSSSAKLRVETEASARSEDGFLEALSAAADRVGVALGLESTTAIAARGRRSVAWVPMLGGGLLAAGSAFCFVFAGVQFGELDRELTAMGVVTARARSLSDTGKVFQTVAWVTSGVAVAALVTSAILFLSGEPPVVTPTVSVSPAGSVTFGFGGQL